jgi:hypothetical protein
MKMRKRFAENLAARVDIQRAATGKIAQRLEYQIVVSVKKSR